MAMLRPLKLNARAEAILVNTSLDIDLSSERIPSTTVTYAGFEGEAHSGLTRSSCVRVRRQYAEGTEIRNVRQISIISVEDMKIVAKTMGVDRLEPEWLGANLLVSGIPEFTTMPPSTRLIFESGASLVVDMENGPCQFPGQIIEQYHPGKGALFPKACMGRRGVTAWAEREGHITAGEAITVHIPPQRIYEIPS